MTDPSTTNSRLQKIRDLIEKAKSADAFFAGQRKAGEEINANIYQKHLDALISEHDALMSDDYMNARESVSIRALVAYTAYCHNIREDIACAIVEEQFGLEEIRKLPKQKYQDVVNYLVDFDPKKTMN